MDWGSLILRKIVRVTVGFGCGVVLICLLRSFGQPGGFSVATLTAYVGVFVKTYLWILAAIWAVLIVIEVARDARRIRTGKRN